MDVSTLNVRGAGGGGGGSGVELGESVRSTQIAEVVDVLSEGEVQGLTFGLRGIYLDGVPLENADGTKNFEDVEVAFVPGTQAQGSITGGDGVLSEFAVDVGVLKAAPVVRTITNPAVDSCRVTISIPQLTSTDRGNGNIIGAQFDWAIDVQSSGGGFVEVVRETVHEKTTSRYTRSKRFSLLGPAPWDIRVRRISEDSADTYVVNAFSWATYTEIQSLKLRHPNTAMVRLRVNARAFSRVPTRAYDLMGVRVQVPTNYDPATRTYTGVWDGTFKVAWTDCPPWLMYALVTNTRWGLGRFFQTSGALKWRLYSIAQYCDGMVPDGNGGFEPRFRCGIVMRTQEQAFKWLTDLAAVFRGMGFWAGNDLAVVQDAPAEPGVPYTPANVVPVDGKFFTYAGSSHSRKPTQVTVWFNDRAQLGKLVPETYIDRAAEKQWGIRPMQDLNPLGVWSRGQAQRVGRWAIFSERNEGELVSFRVGLDGHLTAPGGVFPIADPHEAGERLAGRVRVATTTEVTLDSPVTLVAGETYTLTVSLPDPADPARLVPQRRGVASAPGATGVLAVAPPFSEAPAPQSVWLLQSNVVQPTLWRCVGVKEVEGTNEFQITGLRHLPGKYDQVELGIAFEQPSVSRLTPTAPPPGALTITESLYRVGTERRSKVSVSWLVPGPGLAFLVMWRLDAGPWAELPSTTSNLAELDNLPRGALEVTVRSRNALGNLSTTARGSQVLLGRTVAPSDVTSLTAELEEFGVRLRWPALPDGDAPSYQLRLGEPWDTGAVIVDQVAATDYLLRVQGAGAKRIGIKGVALGGPEGPIYSANALYMTVVVPVPAQPALSFALDGAFEVLTLNIPAASFAIDRYERRLGASWDTAVYVDDAKGSTFRRRVDWVGARRYWVAAVDGAGNYGTPASIDVVVSAPGPATAARSEVVDNNALLYWAAPLTGSLPIERYDVRKGATFAGGTAVGSNGNSTFTAVFEQQAGVITYWVASVDSAGNVGPAVGITATINQPPDYVLRTSIDSAFGGTPTNMVVDGGGLVGPVSTTETWQTHFTSRGWSSPQDQVTAGFPLYAEPSVASGSYEEIFDYGTALPATTILATLSTVAIAGTVAVSCQIYTKLLAGDAWLAAAAGATSVLASSFRYVRVVWTFTGAVGANLIRVTSFNLKLSNKLRTDSGTFTITNAATGVFVPFNVPFIDADTPIAQPGGTTALLAVVDFADTPNPAGFTVFLYNQAGAKVTGSGSWTARGY